MIIQGTTPTHAFTVPFDTATVKCARFVYSQDGAVKVVKDKQDVIVGNGTIKTTLTQADTFEFKADAMVRLLLRVLTESGAALVSEPVDILCLGCCDKEVLA